MSDHILPLNPLSNNSSYPVSEDESRKEILTKGLINYRNNEDYNISFEKNNEENKNIFNFIEFHLQNMENSSCFANFQKYKKKIHLRPNALTFSKESDHEFFRKEVIKNQKKLFEFLKVFIMEIANSNTLKTFKDYYPKVSCFFIE